MQDYGMQVLGIEPTHSTAQIARKIGVETLGIFLTESSAKDVKKTYGPADFVAANNVLAHVPNLNDFVAGIRELLSETGIATIEFPHLMNLI
jgi:2-polyprenyl-3-methyl-5-hydroxy-6-metoxy-1,4-benzoquinol methylase